MCASQIENFERTTTSLTEDLDTLKSYMISHGHSGSPYHSHEAAQTYYLRVAVSG